MSERMTYGEVLRLTEGHGTSELWERWQEMTTRLAAAEYKYAARGATIERLTDERDTARQALAAAEEQLADANRGYSLLCDEEARLNDDLAAARHALDIAQEDARQGWAS